MIKRILSVAALLIIGVPEICAQQNGILVQIRILDDEKGTITPAMMCVTNTRTNSVHIPPTGDTAPPPTFPAPFFSGIQYSSDRNWIGPVRRMNGPGGINHQRTYVYGSTPSVPHWTASVIYQVSGDVDIRLNKGNWRIDVRRGMEYIPVTKEFTIGEDTSAIVQNIRLKRWTDLPAQGWYSGDVHVHHTLDKQSDTAYLFKLAEAEDLHMMNMLEMGDRQSIHFRAPKYGLKGRMVKGDYCLAIGQEEPRSDYGHVIGLNIDTLARDTSRYNHYDVVFDKIHESDKALAGYAHFAYRGEGVVQGMAYYAPFGHIDFVELLQNTKLNRPDYYDYLNMGFRISAAAGSDFPWGSTPGDGRTFVYTGATFSPDKWFQGLKRGNSFVSNGPVLFLSAAGAIPGEEIKSRAGDNLKIKATVYCHPSIGGLKMMEIVTKDGVIAQVDLAGRDSATVEIDYRVTTSDWIAAYAVCDNEALAHTSPVYISVSGRPVSNAAKLAPLVNRQMEILKEVENLEKNKKVPDAGVLKRVEKAEKYYRILLKRAR